VRDRDAPHRDFFPKIRKRSDQKRSEHHNPMEPHAIVAEWEGDTLSIDTPSQGMAMAQARLAGLFGIAPDKIHIRSPFLGGGFGCKGMISGPQVLGAIAARAVGRPVKLVLRREQMFRLCRALPTARLGS
jgi:xanthine dehydrogenase YagR molybdenum-binding subunit